MRRLEPRGGYGGGVYRKRDAYPFTASDADYRALLAEQLRRDRMLTDELPDIGPEHFATDAEYKQWVAEGGKRFFS